MRAALVTALALAALAAGGPATAAARPPFVARLYAPGHHPHADHRWPITITARTHGGKRLSGRVSYEYLYGGRVVSRQSNYRFRNGRFHDSSFVWPKRAIGYHLTFRPVIRTRLGVVRIPYWVVVQP